MSDTRRSLNSLDDIEFAVRRIEELEAKLAKTMAALNYFLLRDPDKPTSWEYSRNRAEELARTTLAELKEEDRG